MGAALVIPDGQIAGEKYRDGKDKDTYKEPEGTHDSA